jgi:hypothetical protein
VSKNLADRRDRDVLTQEIATSVVPKVMPGQLGSTQSDYQASLGSAIFRFAGTSST